MRNKTHLCPSTQWYRTLELGKEFFGHHGSLRNPYSKFGKAYRLGQITKTHRLFLDGDFVFVTPNNGMYQRYPVFGVSSKGYRVAGLYLKFFGNDAECGPLRLIELPDHLVGMPPDGPEVWQFVATQRVGFTAPG